MVGNRPRGAPETVNDFGTVTKPSWTERLRGVGYNGMFIGVGSYWLLRGGIFSLIEFDQSFLKLRKHEFKLFSEGQLVHCLVFFESQRTSRRGMWFWIAMRSGIGFLEAEHRE
jgi:hypothetical protein